jgi:release factor glutamine methyltransferase
MEQHYGLEFEKVIADVKIQEISDDILNKKIERILKNEPIQYVLEEAWFYSRKFIVNPDVLIPRPETEELVSEIIRKHSDPEARILDIGTGSGCIAITLACEIQGAKVFALDNSKKALKVARTNAKNLGAGITFLEKDILKCQRLPEKYTIIVSNPPYVTEQEKQEMLPNVLEYEPHSALFVRDEDPLIFYRKILLLAKDSLLNHGCLYFEINEQFGHEIIGLAKSVNVSMVQIIKDIHGRDRIAVMKFD